MNNVHRTVIEAKLPRTVIQDDGSEKEVFESHYFMMDTISPREISTNSKVVSQPLQSGDTMSDHMYREPISYSISGTFSLNGKYQNDNTYIDVMGQGSDRLTAIQKVFEYIKNKGILCNIITMGVDDNTNKIDDSITQFIVRNNMALYGISWTESLNTLKFSFKFQEIIMVDQIEYDIDPLDRNLSGLSVPSALGISQILSQNNELGEMITKILYNNHYFEESFFEWWKNFSYEAGANVSATIAWAAVSWLAGLVLGLSVKAAIAMGTAALTATLFPVGTILVSGGIIIGAFICVFNFWFNNKKRKAQKKLRFKGSKDDLIRLEDLIERCQASLNKMTFNLEVYSLPKMEDNQTSVQIVLSIGADYYYLTFTKNPNNISQPFHCEITTNAPYGEDEANIINKKHVFPVVTNLTGANQLENLWFKDTSLEYYVYLVNPALDDYINDTSEKKDVVKQSLESYSIWVSKGPLENNIDKVTKALEDILESQGYVI